jgi:hypothetical protein
MLWIGCGVHTVGVSIGELPSIYSQYVGHADFHDDLGIRDAEGTALCVMVSGANSDWPVLVVALRFEPGPRSSFHPGIMLLPDTDLVLIGAGTRLLAYGLSPPRRLWEDTTDVGFWGWRRHGDLVLMSAELELAAWDLTGQKLWSTFVEPPWTYEIHDDRLILDVMGRKSNFDAKMGPAGSVRAD